MSDDQAELDRIDQLLKKERARLRDVESQADDLDQDVERPQPRIDHANDGGVI